MANTRLLEKLEYWVQDYNEFKEDCQKWQYYFYSKKGVENLLQPTIDFLVEKNQKFAVIQAKEIPGLQLRSVSIDIDDVTCAFPPAIFLNSSKIKQIQDSDIVLVSLDKLDDDIDRIELFVRVLSKFGLCLYDNENDKSYCLTDKMLLVFNQNSDIDDYITENVLFVFGVTE